MAAYIVRRMLLMIPTLFGIILLNFLIVQVAPGGPVEQMIARLQGMNTSVTQRFSGGGQDVGAATQMVQQ
ncbi:MAG: microcin ABC transporter permease, partial [Alphaproteobacteria bacterium]|nr:microcin ABC transporter permease [Alphaproteobacteria bacterium]